MIFIKPFETLPDTTFEKGKQQFPKEYENIDLRYDSRFVWDHDDGFLAIIENQRDLDFLNNIIVYNEHLKLSLGDIFYCDNMSGCYISKLEFSNNELIKMIELGYTSDDEDILCCYIAQDGEIEEGYASSQKSIDFLDSCTVRSAVGDEIQKEISFHEKYFLAFDDYERC